MLAFESLELTFRAFWSLMSNIIEPVMSLICKQTTLRGQSSQGTSEVAAALRMNELMNHEALEARRTWRCTWSVRVLE